MGYIVENQSQSRVGKGDSPRRSAGRDSSHDSSQPRRSLSKRPRDRTRVPRPTSSLLPVTNAVTVDSHRRRNRHFPGAPMGTSLSIRHMRLRGVGTTNRAERHAVGDRIGRISCMAAVIPVPACHLHKLLAAFPCAF